MSQSNTSANDSASDYSQDDIDKIKAIAEETSNILAWIEAEAIGLEEE